MPPPTRTRRSLAALMAFLPLVGIAHSTPTPTPIPAPAPAPAPTSASGARIAVLDFELNDLTLDPNNPAERERTASIKPMLEQALTETHHVVVSVDSAAQRTADEGVGYLFDHADATAALGRAVGAQWVVVGRVHKASFLFVYFKAHIVNATTGEQVADLVVEVKGPQKALTLRGVQSLAKQISDAIEKQRTNVPRLTRSLPRMTRQRRTGFASGGCHIRPRQGIVFRVTLELGRISRAAAGAERMGQAGRGFVIAHAVRCVGAA